MARDAQARERRTKLTAYFLFGAIILVFVFWGMKNNDMPGSGSGYAATVNNTVISIGEFRRAFEQQMQFYSRVFGKQFDVSAYSNRLRESALEQLIRQELLVQGAMDQGIKASDAEVRQQIFDIPAFQKDGRFQREAYTNYLSYTHMSAAQFETDLRKNLVLKDLQQIFELATRPTTSEVEKEIQARSFKVNLEFVVFDQSVAGQQPKVSEADAEKFLKSEDSAKKLEEFYNQNKAEFVKDGEVHARHILIKAAQGDKSAETSALAKIKSIQTRLKTESFENVARDVSEDEGSKAKGGDLGYFSKGRMVPQFEDSAFSLDKGHVSAPVQTAYGYHLIEVLDKRGRHVTTLESARKDIAKRLLAKELGQQWLLKLEKVMAQSEGPEKNMKISSLVNEAGLKWDTTGAFDAGSQSVPKIGAVDGLTVDAFGLSQTHLYPNRVYRNANKAYVVRFKDSVEEKSLAKLDETSAQISKSRAQDIQQTWEKKLAGQSKIQRNLAILAEQ